MKKQFVTYEIALKLKELGFNKACFAVFDRKGELTGIDFIDISNLCGIDYSEASYNYPTIAPLWQQIIDWFDNKNIIIGIDINPGTLFYRVHLYKRYYHNPGRLVIGEYFLSGEFNNFISKEEAREQAILKAIELCKEKKN